MSTSTIAVIWKVEGALSFVLQMKPKDVVESTRLLGMNSTLHTYSSSGNQSTALRFNKMKQKAMAVFDWKKRKATASSNLSNGYVLYNF
jgi:hypothetical protein